MTRLPYCSKFTYGVSSVLQMELPITPWDFIGGTIGGDIEADSGTRAAFAVRRDDQLTFALRFYEDQWPEIQALIDFGQTGETVRWYPNPEDNAIEVYIDAPALGDTFSSTQIEQYPRAMTLQIIVRKGNGTGWGDFGFFGPSAVVGAEVASIEISPTLTFLYSYLQGGPLQRSVQLTAILRDIDDSIIADGQVDGWMSDNTDVITVTPDGLAEVNPTFFGEFDAANITAFFGDVTSNIAVVQAGIIV